MYRQANRATRLVAPRNDKSLAKTKETTQWVHWVVEWSRGRMNESLCPSYDNLVVGRYCKAMIVVVPAVSPFKLQAFTYSIDRKASSKVQASPGRQAANRSNDALSLLQRSSVFTAVGLWAAGPSKLTRFILWLRPYKTEPSQSLQDSVIWRHWHEFWDRSSSEFTLLPFALEVEHRTLFPEPSEEDVWLLDLAPLIVAHDRNPSLRSPELDFDEPSGISITIQEMEIIQKCGREIKSDVHVQSLLRTDEGFMYSGGFSMIFCTAYVG